MSYRKFQAKQTSDPQTLGGLGTLGGVHPEILRLQQPKNDTPTPPKVAKAPKVYASVDGFKRQASVAGDQTILLHPEFLARKYEERGDAERQGCNLDQNKLDAWLRSELAKRIPADQVEVAFEQVMKAVFELVPAPYPALM
jgi:hypothetical protein